MKSSNQDIEEWPFNVQVSNIRACMKIRAAIKNAGWIGKTHSLIRDQNVVIPKTTLKG